MNPIRLVLTFAVAAAAITAGSPPALAAAPAGARIDLRVLVVSDGAPQTDAIAARLSGEGVPFDRINLADPNRQTITPQFLADTVDGAPRARYQAVVLPNADPFGDPAELSALTDYERTYGIRQVDAYVWPSAAVGLGAPVYTGPLDAITATVTDAGRAGPFGYLRGPVPFENVDPNAPESYGFPAPAAAGAALTPLLTATTPAGTGVLIGQYDSGGRSELALTFSYNAAQQQFGLLAHGIVTWMTGGVHLGYQRNYLSVDVDDVFLPDARWSTDGNCTPGEDCTGGQTTADIRMSADDAAYAASWERSHNFTLDMVYNGAGSDQASTTGPDPLTTALTADQGDFRWTDHTYDHAFLGCVQDLTVRPWRCATDPATGAVRYAGQDEIQQDIARNVSWGTAHGLTVDPTELITGEHSGLRILPQQPDDNPNLAPALAATGVAWLGSDHSRDPDSRVVGPATTVSRYPVNVFYNVSSQAEEVDEYNWIYDSRANGGSGLCEDHPDVMTCAAPLDPGTGYAGYIVPVEARLMLGHVLGNDPRPHFVHQSNLAGDRLIYPLLDTVLGAYGGFFADDTPVVCQRLSAGGGVLQRQQAWQAAVAAGSVTAYRRDGTVTVIAPAGLQVPVTAPDGTRIGDSGGEPFGDAYAGERSAFLAADTGQPIALALPQAG